jgi:hypothetical protein
VLGKPGLALSFFFGDEFGSLSAFFVDAVASVLFAACLRRGIIAVPSVWALVAKARDAPRTLPTRKRNRGSA